MIKNTASQVVAFQAVNTSTGAAVTTGTPTVYVTIDGGTQATGTGTSTHEGNGQWSYVPTQAETNGDHIAFTFTLANAINQTVNVYPVTLADYQADVSGLSTFDPATDTVANVTAVATCTSNSDMRGTDSALLAASAPSNFSSLGINVSGHVSRVTLVDTTTTNTDMRGTDGANTVVPDNTSIAAILVDTGTTIPGQISGLNDLNSTEVQSAAAAALTAYDPPTNAEMEARTLVAANYATAANLQTVDDNVDAILVDTAELQSKLIPMLEADGSGGFQYTALALENAPSGGGGPGGPGDATEAKQDQIIATLAGIEGAGFDTLTDSLEAIRDRGDAAWVTGGGGGGIWQLTVTVTDTSTNAVQGARVAVDGTSLTVTTNTNGEAVLNLNDGSYTLNISAPSGYSDPAPESVTISGADGTLGVVVTPGPCEVPPL